MAEAFQRFMNRSNFLQNEERSRFRRGPLPPLSALELPTYPHLKKSNAHGFVLHLDRYVYFISCQLPTFDTNIVQ